MESAPIIELAETAHALRKAFARRASTLGVTGAQWKVLVRLSRTPGLRQVELADLLDLEPITLSRIVDKLAEAGLVERVSDPADRRAWRLQLTAKSAPLVEKLRALGDALADEAFEGITPQEVEFMRERLARVRDNLAACTADKKAVGA